MNLFVLDLDPRQAARDHCDRHVPKMILETAQMLSTAHHAHGSTVQGLYRPAYANHPCTRWVRENSENYTWAWSLLDELLWEFQLRRGKLHATQRLLGPLATLPSLSDEFLFSERTPFALAMPDEFKSDDPVESYRNYYRKAKAHFASWTWPHAQQPIWF